VKKPLSILCLGLTLVGCTGRSQSSSGTAPVAPAKAPNAATVAIVNGQPITIEQLDKPLIEAYGLNVLLNLVQLEMAKQAAVRNNARVTEADVQKEMDDTLDAMFKDSNAKMFSDMEVAESKGQKDVAEKIRQQMKVDNERGLEQFLGEKHLTRQEYELVIRTNAYLRKIVEPTLKDAITDKMLEDGFRFQYGEKVQVRHIQCANWKEIADAKKMLADGISFGDVARELSRNPRTAPLGGELRPFSRQEPGLTEVFKDAAFALKEGEISDAVITNGAYHLIKLEKRIPPTAVKLEDVKDAIRKQLYESLITNSMKQLRNELAQDALKTLKIYDPVLKAQFDKKISDGNAQVKGKEETLKKLTEEREAAMKAIATQPTTAPATMPASTQATAPAAQ